ncbi:hypothetical protein KUL42_11860 [Alteromonas sp. KUL42]|uniref:MobV family relaxase n=1 Tax=Alteromonas sp. KUL42 TaxID=2480797 RepID=UPI0010FFAB94|nr:MobV family relaxase [Alteromonas sp. KUL42]GEA06425.1 hypothetical protein KUL42_11860 [Alteromonas sp. KUL42]
MQTDKNDMIMRCEKLHTVATLTRQLKHCLRAQYTPNADSDLSHKNEILTPKAGTTFESVIHRFNERIKRMDKKPRKNAVLALDFVFSASPAALHKKSLKERREYFIDCAKWFRDKVGNENILTAVIHRDETGGEHAHFLCLPIPKGQNSLNCRELVGGHKQRMSEIQDEFYERVAKKHGFSRGMKGSRATHTSVREYHSLVNETLPKLRREKVELMSRNEKLDNQIIEKRNILETLEKKISKELEEFKRLVTYSYHFMKDQMIKRWRMLHLGGEEFEFDYEEPTQKQSKAEIIERPRQDLTPFRRRM